MKNIFKNWFLSLAHPLAWVIVFCVITAYFISKSGLSDWWYLLCFPSLLVGYYFNILIKKIIELCK